MPESFVSILSIVSVLRFSPLEVASEFVPPGEAASVEFVRLRFWVLPGCGKSLRA